MPLVRALLKTAHEAVDAGVDKILGPPPPSAVHPGTPLPPEPTHDPVAPLQEYMDERDARQAERDARHADRHGRRGRRYEDSDPKPRRAREHADCCANTPLGRASLIIAMTRDAEQREIHALRAAARWGVSLMIVGLIFMILVITGEFPTSVDNLKGMGIYATYIAKYCLYMFAGGIALAAAATARRGLRAGRSTLPEQGVFVLALAVSVATIGMSIWLDIRVNNFETSPWWAWLILALIIFQRTVFAIACIFSIWTLNLADSRIGAGSNSEGSDAKGKADVAPAVADVV